MHVRCFLCQTQILLQSPALGDVAHSDNDIFLVGAMIADANVYRQLGTVLATEGQVEGRAHGPSRRLFKVAPSLLDMSRPIAFRQQHLNELTNQFFSGIAEHLLRLFIEQANATAGIDLENGVGGGSEQVLEPSLACTQIMDHLPARRILSNATFADQQLDGKQFRIIGGA